MMYLWVILGGACGAAARFAVMGAVTRLMGHGFPYGTMTVNILGSLLMGVFIVSFAKMLGVSQEFKAFATVGLLGGFTTFSTFSLDAVTLIERHDYGAAAIYMASSVFLSVAALLAGMALARGVLS